MDNCLRKMIKDDLKMVLDWRNSKNVRENMYNHEIIEWEEHVDWFSKVSNDESSIYLIFEENKKPMGVISFTNIDKKNKRASWAFYSGNTSVRGIGSKMEKAALSYAFNVLKLNKLCCEVLEFNDKVISFHQKHGFKVEGVLKRHYERDGTLYDIYQLAIFSRDWEKKIESDITLNKKFTWDFSFSGQKIEDFSELSGDKNPIHIDEKYALANGFDKCVAHGALLSAEISAVAASNYPGIGTVYLSQKINFNKPIYPDMKILGEAKLLTQIGRYVLILFEFFDEKRNKLASCESEFLVKL